MKKIVKTDSEWKKALSKQAYEITRKSGTERPFTNHDFKGSKMIPNFLRGKSTSIISISKIKK